MRRFLLTALITFTLVLGATGAAPVAYAGLLPEGNACPTYATWNADNDQCEDERGASVQLITEDQFVQQGADAEKAYSDKIAADKAAADSPLSLAPKTEVSGVFAKIMIFIMSLFASLLGIAMVTLNYAVYYTVIKMGDYVHSLAAIGVTWSILRDLANIMFIFGFIGAGIATIVNVDLYGWKTKMLPMLLIGAIFLNFSLFITEAMIDGTNVFATQFYKQINGGVLPTVDTLREQGISDKIMQQLGLQTLYDVRKDPNLLNANNSIYIAFMGIILFIVTAFVMFSLAFILFARFVALIFFIILCPVAFMGLAIPQMNYRATQWWKNFLEQIITAPVLLLLLYVALAVITDDSFLSFGAKPNWFGIVSATDGSMNLGGLAGALLSFIVAIGLLLVVVIKAKSMSAFGAAGAIKLGGKLTFGATAFGLRSSAGLGSQLAAQAIRRSKYGGTKIGRIAATTFDKGAKGSWDVRGVAMGGGLKGIGIDAGDAQKGGYRARKEASVKGHEEYIKSVEKEIEEKGIDSVIAAQQKRAEAENEYNEALKESEKAKAAVDEVARLEKVVADNIKNNIRDIKAINDRNAARTSLPALQARLNAATANTTQKKVDFNNAEKAEKNANSDIGREKNAAKTKYAENIQGGFFGNNFKGWAAFGPGGAAAAKHMIKDATKKETDAQKALKTLEKVIKDGATESGSENKNDSKSAPAPAPAGGNH